MSRRWARWVDLAWAIRRKRERLDPVLGYSRRELLEYQERRWRAVARLAAKRSPFYREQYRGIDLERDPLQALPPVEKGQLMDRFDETVTDPSLRLADLEAYLRAGDGERAFRDRYQVLVTSGTTGQRGIFLDDPEEWRARIAVSLRCQELMGSRPRLLPRPSMATLTSTHPFHISCRLARAMDVGLYRRLVLDPQEPLPRMLERLQRFQPEVIFGYPSLILPVAQAQREGRLQLRPRRVIAGAEAVTPALRAAVRDAWGCDTFDLYATTETGALAVETPDHQGLLLMEDNVIVEVVDEQDRPVPDGVRGHHLLLTCLNRLTQPLIRYRVTDQIIVEAPSAPTPDAWHLTPDKGGWQFSRRAASCRPRQASSPRSGRCTTVRSTRGVPVRRQALPFRRIRAIDGRVRDSLRLLTRGGEEVELRPSVLLAGLLSLPGARQVRVVQEPGEIQVSVVAAEADGADLPVAVERWFQALARENDLRLPPLVIQRVPRLAGSDATMGKFRPVECRI
jgi:phenylacetate-coenzyme A ligase PaaK-like adenylate-forming protein